MPKWINKFAFYGIMLMVADCLVFFVLMMYGYRVRLDYDLPFLITWQSVAIVSVNVIFLYLLSCYEFGNRMVPRAAMLRALVATVVAAFLISTAAFFLRPDIEVSILWRGNLSISLLFFSFWAMVSRFLLATIWLKLWSQRKWIFLGSASWAGRLELLSRTEPLDLEIDIIVLESASSLRDVSAQGKSLTFQTSRENRSVSSVYGVVVESLAELSQNVRQQIIAINFLGFQVSELTEFYENQYGRTPVLSGPQFWPSLSSANTRIFNNINWKLKRGWDVAISACCLVLFSPLIALLALLIRLDSPGGAFFVQKRVGQGGRIFKLYKLRTMRIDIATAQSNWTQVSDIRITRVGRVLRRYRLDELPQFVNVIFGAMSLVGPRPEQPEIVGTLERVIPFFELRHLIKPGITGWAQVRYPYGASIEDARNKLEYDLYYLKNFSLFLDFYIMLRTVRVVIARDGR